MERNLTPLEVLWETIFRNIFSGLTQLALTEAYRSLTPIHIEVEGAALGRRCPAHDRAEFSEDYGLPGSVDAKGGLGSERGGSSAEKIAPSPAILHVRETPIAQGHGIGH